MNMIRHAFRWLTIVALACSAGVLPSCASMGGGGMKYLASDPAPIDQRVSI
jgi:hypothetical protein